MSMWIIKNKNELKTQETSTHICSRKSIWFTHLLPPPLSSKLQISPSFLSRLCRQFLLLIETTEFVSITINENKLDESTGNKHSRLQSKEHLVYSSPPLSSKLQISPSFLSQWCRQFLLLIDTSEFVSIRINKFKNKLKTQQTFSWIQRAIDCNALW